MHRRWVAKPNCIPPVPPCLWKNRLPWNQYPVPKKAGGASALDHWCLCHDSGLLAPCRGRASPGLAGLWGAPRPRRQAFWPVRSKAARPGLTAQTGAGSFSNDTVTVVLFIVLLIYGCAGSSLLWGLFSNPGEEVGLLSSFPAGDSCGGGFSCWGAWVQYVAFGGCGSQTLEHRLSSCGAQA